MVPKCSRQVFDNSVRGSFVGFRFFVVLLSPNRFRVVGWAFAFSGVRSNSGLLSRLLWLVVSPSLFGCRFLRLFSRGLLGALVVALVPGFWLSARFCISCVAGAALFISLIIQNHGVSFYWRGRGSFLRVRRFKVSRLWRGVLAFPSNATATHQRQHNKALHPTAYSLRFGRSSRRFGFRRRVSLVVAPLR